MFGPRMLLGALIGGAAVYFLDPQNGGKRRERVRAWWEQARTSETSATIGEKVNEMGGRVNEKVSEIQSRIRKNADRDDVPEPTSVQ